MTNEVDRRSVCEAVLNPTRLHTRDSVIARPSSVAAEPGLYAWYFDEAPAAVPTESCHRGAAGELLYVGISPGRPPANGKPASKENLRSRIRYHYTGNAEGSTLRLTIGCHLAETLGIELRRMGSGNRLTFTPPGEAALSEWLAQHARVAVVKHPRPWEVEAELIRSLSLPLNIEHNSGHAYYAQNRAVRARHRDMARALPVWVPQSPAAVTLPGTRVWREADVQDAFVAYLKAGGWSDIMTSPRGVDVIARRGGETLKAEVKGVTSEAGLDTDTLFGQILRAMDSDAMTSYAIVVPETLATKVRRVSAEVRRRLELSVYLVDEGGAVRQMAD